MSIFVRCRYSTINIAMFFHFFLIIIISGSSLLCYSIVEILLALVLSVRLLFIIQWSMLSMRFPIMVRFYFTEVMSLWNFYIYANWWKVLLIAGLVPIILISSSSTGDFFHDNYSFWMIMVHCWIKKIVIVVVGRP